MTFVQFTEAKLVALTAETVSDGTYTADSPLSDGSTSADAGEIRKGMAGYWSRLALGFALSEIDSMTVRFFDGSWMDSGDALIYPYDSTGSDIVTGNEIQFTIVLDSAYQNIVCTAGFIADLGDVGTDEIAIRWVSDDSGVLRGRATEIQIEVIQTIGGGGMPTAALTRASTRHRRRKRM